MVGSTPKPFDEALRELWAHVDSVCSSQTGIACGDQHIGVTLKRPKDTEEALGDFSLLLMNVLLDAANSDANARLFETNGGFRIVTGNFAWAKRLFGILMSRAVKFTADDVVLVENDVLSLAREIRMGWGEWN